MDFTSFSLEPGKTGHGSKDQLIYIQNCIVVLEYIDESGSHELEYLDFLCQDPNTNKNDYHFVLNVWIKLFSMKNIKDRFKCVEIWSDGGPHHFKTRWCQYMWHMLSTLRFNGKRITHNFFSSYHGHSLADAHAATDKRILHTQYNISQQLRLNPTEADMYWGPSSATDLAALLSSHATKTECIVLPTITRDENNKPDILPLDHIKRKHCFVYENNLCRAYEQTGEGEGQSFSFVPST